MLAPNDRWDRYFLRLALENARQSKDPSTQVGAVLADDDRVILAAGFNGMPRGLADTPERLGDRETKLRLVVHAEMNAALAAARVGARLKGSTLFLAASDASGAVWGGPPCVRCTVELIQAGVAQVVSWPRKSAPSRWADDLALALEVLAEAGVAFREVVS